MINNGSDQQPQLDQRTDAELLADWSIEATRMGRLEVAEALLRLAIQATRADQQARAPRPPFIGLVGQVRSDAPRLRAAAPAGPTGNGDADLDREQVAATAIIGIHHNSPGIDRRCRAKVLQGNVYDECHGAAYWVPAAGNTGDGHWRHVDTELDNDHVPVIDL